LPWGWYNIVITTDWRGGIGWVDGALTRLIGHTLAGALGPQAGRLVARPAHHPATFRVMRACVV
jgi:hypothetical protein